jgi:hypothetical protein
MLVAIFDRIAALEKQGKSLEELIDVTPTAAYDGKWAAFVNGALFSKLVYAAA